MKKMNKEEIKIEKIEKNGYIIEKHTKVYVPNDNYKIEDIFPFKYVVVKGTERIECKNVNEVNKIINGGV
jgi:hypothetical protein